MTQTDSPGNDCRDWIVELPVRLTEALLILHSVVASCDVSGCGTETASQRKPRPNDWCLLACARDHPDFLEKTGVPSDEWRERMRLALHCGAPKAWTNYECDMGGTRYVIKHSLSPVGEGRVFGALQYYPLMLREKSPVERDKIYAELPMGIYSLDTENTFLHTVEAAKCLFRPPYIW